jgi:hypothetical protein
MPYRGTGSRPRRGSSARRFFIDFAASVAFSVGLETICGNEAHSRVLGHKAAFALPADMTRQGAPSARPLFQQCHVDKRHFVAAAAMLVLASRKRPGRINDLIWVPRWSDSHSPPDNYLQKYGNGALSTDAG